MVGDGRGGGRDPCWDPRAVTRSVYYTGVEGQGNPAGAPVISLSGSWEDEPGGTRQVSGSSRWETLGTCSRAGLWEWRGGGRTENDCDTKLAEPVTTTDEGGEGPRAILAELT